MWSCRKCGKPVFFAERKQSIGYDWHPECLKCEECGKVLKTGQHAEHKGVPYCHVPCYGALFGPQLFGHGTRVESHKSFGRIESKGYGNISRNQLETMIKAYNHYYEVHGGSGGIKSREVNGRLVLEGVLKLYWGIHSPIQLKEDDDQRLPCNTFTSKYQRRISNGGEFRNTPREDSDSDDDSNSRDPGPQVQDEDRLSDEMKLLGLNGGSSSSSKSNDDEVPGNSSLASTSPVPPLRNGDAAIQSTKSTALRRRPGRRFDKARLRRRCSINGHFYNRETSVFTPPYGSSMSVWTTSLVSTQEVVNMLLDKYRVECSASNFALFLVKDNGERRRLRDEEYPMLLRVAQGPDETVSKLFLVESNGDGSDEVSAAVAQFLHLSQAECNAILRLFCEEEEREVLAIKMKNREMKRRIKKRMQELKVKL